MAGDTGKLGTNFRCFRNCRIRHLRIQRRLSIPDVLVVARYEECWRPQFPQGLEALLGISIGPVREVAGYRDDVWLELIDDANDPGKIPRAVDRPDVQVRYNRDPLLFFQAARRDAGPYDRDAERVDGPDSDQRAHGEEQTGSGYEGIDVDEEAEQVV